MPKLPSCSGCCIRQVGCDSCSRCLPKYLCVDVQVTPGPYTDLTCCDVDAYGYGHFSFRMGNTCDAWAGSSTCSGIDTSFDLSVSLNSECNTVVSSSLIDSPLVFEGVLPSTMNGSFENDQGDVFDWEISRANVIENPLIRDKIEAGICPPCSCAMCLPERLCVLIQADGDAYNAEIDRAVSFLWNCRTRSWVADGETPKGISISIRLKTAASGVCGIDVVVTGEYGGYTGIILLESDMHPRKFHGTLCKDSDDLISVLGVPELRPCVSDPCDDPPPQQFVSYVNETLSIMDGDVQTGSVAIRDQSCGDCTPPCRTGCCPDFPEAGFITVDTNCAYGVISVHLTTEGDAAIWSSSAGSTIIFRNCDTITGDESLVEIDVYAGIACSPGQMTVTIATDPSLSAGVLFIGTYQCAGGTLTQDSPEATEFFSTTGSCCAYRGTPSTGSVSLSA